MPAPDELVESILSASDGLSVADLLARHPDLARRTAQRWLRELIDAGQITTIGEGRARRYLRAASLRSSDVDLADAFPASIPLSEDSQDIIDYIDQPLVARRPVGYQREFIKLRRKPRRSGRGWIARGAKPLYYLIWRSLLFDVLSYDTDRCTTTAAGKVRWRPQGVAPELLLDTRIVFLPYPSAGHALQAVHQP